MDYLGLLGYFASGLIAISMTMNSIVKFRLINLVGASCFSVYGFAMGTLPVGFLNGFIVCVNLYYLWGIFTRKEVFETLEIRSGSEYLIRFVNFHNADIQKICPGFVYQLDLNTLSFFILRNMQVAGLFLAHREGDVLTVGLDYVIPEYRDFKNGKFIYKKLSPELKSAGIIKIRASETNRFNDQYFRKIGFKRDSEGFYSLDLQG
jgi:hypothetical protein